MPISMVPHNDHTIVVRGASRNEQAALTHPRTRGAPVRAAVFILVAAENIIRTVIAVPRIDAIDRIAIRQRCFGDDDPEHLAFSGPLELEDVAIAFRKRVFPEWKIGAERAVREPDGFQVFFVIANEPLDLCNAVSVLND